MRIETRAFGQAWRSTRLVLCGTLLMALPGCICINNQVMIPTSSGSYAARPTGTAPPSGGNFAAVMAPVAGTQGSTTICQQTVTKYNSDFWPPVIPGPTGGENRFQGWLYNTNTGKILTNTTYVLQWIIDSTEQGCANNVSGSTTDKRFPARSGVYYKIIAHYKVGHVPNTNHKIELRGAWITL